MPVARPGFMTVADALTLPALRRALPRVVAGEDHVHRPVRWVHAGEVANIAALLRGGELLLTTGMGVGVRSADQRRFVAELAAREVAAVAVELGDTFATALPAALVAAAEQRGLPLIELHAQVPFVAVTEAIHTAIVDHRYELLRRAALLQDRFSALMLDGEGVPAILSALAGEVANPVFLEGGDGRLLYWAAPAGGTSLTAWRQARAAGTFGAEAPVSSGDGRPAGRLVALPVDAPLDTFAPLAVERAAGIVALALLGARQEQELLALGRGDVLAKLAAGAISPADARAGAEAMGFADRRACRLLPVVAHVEGPERRAAAALRDLERELARTGLPVLLGVDASRSSLLLVVSVGEGAERAAVAANVAAIVREQSRRLLGAAAVVGVGPLASWETVAAGLRDAAESAAAASALPAGAWYDATAMPLDLLLWRLRGEREVEGFVDRMLGPVLIHDARRKHALMPTLEALCEHGGRKSEAARALHLNRQALYDRIARLERVLDADLSDPGVLLALQVAVRARRHVGSGRPVASRG